MFTNMLYIMSEYVSEVVIRTFLLLCKMRKKETDYLRKELDIFLGGREMREYFISGT